MKRVTETIDENYGQGKAKWWFFGKNLDDLSLTWLIQMLWDRCKLKRMRGSKYFSAKDKRILKCTSIACQEKVYMKKWNTILILISFLNHKLMNQHQANKQVLVVTLVKIHCQRSTNISNNNPIAEAATVPAIRHTLRFFTSCLTEVFDKCKITDGNEFYILMAVAEGLRCVIKSYFIF